MNKNEINYSTIEKKCLSVVYGVKYFRPYLWGGKFTILTDYRPLAWLFNVPDMNSWLARWRILLQEFDYEIKYKPGSENTNANALSRIFVINSLMTSDEFMEYSAKNVIINNKVVELMDKIENSPEKYNLALPLSCDANISLNIFRDLINKLGHLYI